MSRVSWEHFHHGADIGVRGCGATPAQAFEQVALALTAVITSLDGVRDREAVDIRIQAQDLEFLLYQWLNELVYQMATRRMLFRHFSVEIQDHSLSATASGEAVNRERHRPAVEVKGATFTGLSVLRDTDGLWRAQCVVDV